MCQVQASWPVWRRCCAPSRAPDPTRGGRRQQHGRANIILHVANYQIRIAGKLACLEALLRSISAAGLDRTVVVSNSTAALDLAGGLCGALGLPTCRIDGATAVDSRQDVVNTFNSQHTAVRVRQYINACLG